MRGLAVVVHACGVLETCPRESPAALLNVEVARGSGEGGGGHLFQASPGALCSNCLSRANKAAVVEVGLVCGDRAILSNIGGAI